jgi:hypothetical protein
MTRTERPSWCWFTNTWRRASICAPRRARRGEPTSQTLDAFPVMARPGTRPAAAASRVELPRRVRKPRGDNALPHGKRQPQLAGGTAVVIDNPYPGLSDDAYTRLVYAPVSAPCGPWGDDDRDAVRALVHEYREAGVGLRTAQSRARREHFARTGRVAAHNASGYRAGCKCRTCNAANLASARRYRDRREAKDAAGATS